VQVPKGSVIVGPLVNATRPPMVKQDGPGTLSTSREKISAVLDSYYELPYRITHEMDYGGGGDCHSKY